MLRASSIHMSYATRPECIESVRAARRAALLAVAAVFGAIAIAQLPSHNRQTARLPALARVAERAPDDLFRTRSRDGRSDGARRSLR